MINNGGVDENVYELVKIEDLKIYTNLETKYAINGCIFFIKVNIFFYFIIYEKEMIHESFGASYVHLQ